MFRDCSVLIGPGKLALTFTYHFNIYLYMPHLRFLVGWSSAPAAPQTYSHGYEPPTEGDSIKARIINLIAAVRTLMRSEYSFLLRFVLTN